MKPTHTPTPWIAEDHLDNGQWQIEGQEYTVMTDFGDYVRPVVVSVMGGGERPFHKQAQANAEFIVRACNAHDELLAVLKEVARFFHDGKGTLHAGALSDLNPENENETIDQAIARIIAKAGGEQ